MRYGFLPKSPESYWLERGKEISLNRFERELNLTAEQSREIKMILDDFVQYYHTLQSQMDEMRADGKLRILSVLNEEQKRKFEQMLSGLGSRQLQ